MIHKIYAFFYAIYDWSEKSFFLAVAALFIVPFTSLENRFVPWLLSLLAVVLSLAARGISHAICRGMLARYRQKKSARDAQATEFLDEEDARARRVALTRQAAIAAETAPREAAEQQQRDLTAWWVNRNRF